MEKSLQKKLKPIVNTNNDEEMAKKYKKNLIEIIIIIL